MFIRVYDIFFTLDLSRSLATEQGNPIPEEPMLFLKPVSAYVEMGGAIEVWKSAHW